jgi:hypothetical protein
MATQFNAEETQMFAQLEVEPTDTGLKNLIQAQRGVNGSLCQALWAILDALETQVTGEDPSGKGRSVAEAIVDARTLTRKVAGEPPGCRPTNPASGSGT